MGARRAKASCEHVSHSPEKRPMPDKTACTPLPVTPLAFRLREGQGRRPCGYWTRQTGRQESRAGEDRETIFQTRQGGRRSPHFSLTCQDAPLPSFHTLSLRTPPPSWLPVPGRAPPFSTLPQTPKQEPRNQRMSPVCPQKRCDGLRGREGCGRGAEERGSGRRHSGWREQCISRLRSLPFPFPKIKHGI